MSLFHPDDPSTGASGSSCLDSADLSPLASLESFSSLASFSVLAASALAFSSVFPLSAETGFVSADDCAFGVSAIGIFR